MMKSKRFEPIREIAENSAKDLSGAMAEAGRKVTDLERQLEQLQTYREEYVHKSTQAGGATDPVRLQNFRSFLARLGEAMCQHHKNLGAARAEYERRRSLWTDKRIEVESLGRVVERFKKEEQQAADAREQRDSDEVAMRLGLERRGESISDCSGRGEPDGGESDS